MPNVIEKIAGASESEIWETDWPSRDSPKGYFDPFAADGGLGIYSGRIRDSVETRGELAKRAYNLAKRL